MWWHNFKKVCGRVAAMCTGCVRHCQWLMLWCFLLFVVCACGHKHDLFVCTQVEVLQPHGNLLAKSGTDFKDLSRIDITLPPAAAIDATAAVQAAAATTADGGNSSIQRPTFSTRHIQITSDIPEDPAIAEVGGFCAHSGGWGSRVTHCADPGVILISLLTSLTTHRAALV